MAKIIDLITNKGQVDVTKGVIEEVQKRVPELEFFDFDTVPGTTFQLLARVKNPTVRFRAVGDPVISSRSEYELRTAELKMLSGRVEIPESEVLSNPLKSREEQQTDESTATLTAAFKHVADQIWYGTGSDAKGFAGAPALVDASMVTLAGAGSENANTSVWFVGNGAKTACGIILSDKSKIFEDLEFRKGDILTKDHEGKITGVEPGDIGDLTSWLCFSAANKYKLARLANVTAATGLTDDMLTDVIEVYRQMNDGESPAAIFMSYNARKMLRKSRQLSFTDKKGVSVTQYAPIPTDVDGIPVIATSSIKDTEATVSQG